MHLRRYACVAWDLAWPQSLRASLQGRFCASSSWSRAPLQLELWSRQGGFRVSGDTVNSHTGAKPVVLCPPMAYSTRISKTRQTNECAHGIEFYHPLLLL